MQKHIITLIFLFIFISADAQNTDTLNRREWRPWGVSLNLLGPTMIASANVDYFISRNISVDAGAGLFGAYIGGKTYIGKKQWKGMPYVGYTAALFALPVLDDGGAYIYNYLPVGYHYVSKRGFNFAIEAAFCPGDAPFRFFGQVRLGRRFEKKTKK